MAPTRDSPVRHRYNAVQAMDRLIFDVMLRASDAMDGELEATRNRNGMIQKYARTISPAAWAGDLGQETDAEHRPYMCGVRAIELDMIQRLRAFADAHRLQLPNLNTG